MSLDALAETLVNQAAAADPRVSAFVAANAGAGKTRVLTDRVARLLLAGVDPQRILCITFTKAAAAEMAERLFRLLGGWALAEDGALSTALDALMRETGTRDTDELAGARRLFARALETPGGLKIQTIHSFCQTTLKRFPLEAGVVPGFTVIEEEEAKALREESVADVFRLARRDDALSAAIDRLGASRSAEHLARLISDSVAARAGDVGEALRTDEAAMLARLAADLQIDPALTRDAAIDAFLATLDENDLRRAKAAADGGGGDPKKYVGAAIAAYFAAPTRPAKFDALADGLLTGERTARVRIATNATGKADPWAVGYLKTLQADFLAAFERASAAATFEETAALLRLRAAARAQYDAAKAARGALDFDDLIDRTRRLFASDGGISWVMWKLDQGLDHILVDEAQDTSPDAWRAIEGPLAEFAAGGDGRRRTFFAVGDQKQSIYSFQGADAALFREKELVLGAQLAAAGDFIIKPLVASFRSTAPVLAFVDALFVGDAADGVVAETDGALTHKLTRLGEGGLVELWPLAPRPETPETDPWDAPVDQTSAASPARALARDVAATVKAWLSEGEILLSQGRPIAPADILLLAQTRGAMFHETIRALSEAGVPVAGADVFPLLDDQAAIDLFSIGEAALFPGDDLSLAETLKSPLFDVDDRSLEDLALARGDRSLWRALRARAGERPDWRDAADRLEAARRIALADGAAAFYYHLLETGAPSGWRRFERRLGAAAREAIEEFLRLADVHEQRSGRSLRLFLSALRAGGAEVKRESGELGAAVRVMTVHKAKGLEAPIVFILDAHRPPSTKRAPILVSPGGAPALASSGGADCRMIAEARETEKALKAEEYRRLLYVAATRARDRLYVCGHESGKISEEKRGIAKDGVWHRLASAAFDRLGTQVEAGPEKFGARVRRLRSPQLAATPDLAAKQPGAAAPRFDALTRRAAPERGPRILSPSRLRFGDEGETQDSAFSPLRDAAAARRGRMLHKLLETLPDIDRDRRPAAAARLLAMNAADAPEPERRQWIEEAMRVLDDPAFRAAFEPGGVAEAAIGGAPPGAREGLALAGVIDRLTVREDRVLAVDFKTNRPPPRQIDDIPADYLAQMAGYRALLRAAFPDRPVEMALLWTYEARLVVLPDALLDRAFADTLA